MVTSGNRPLLRDTEIKQSSSCLENYSFVIYISISIFSGGSRQMDVTPLDPALALATDEPSMCSPTGRGGGERAGTPWDSHGLCLLPAPELGSAHGFFPAFPAALGDCNHPGRSALPCKHPAMLITSTLPPLPSVYFYIKADTTRKKKKKRKNFSENLQFSFTATAK